MTNIFIIVFCIEHSLNCIIFYRWGLVNQTPPYSIEFQIIKYDRQIHERFHTSDNESDTIIEYIWPCLIDGLDRICVAKGVVITDEHYLSISKNTSS